MLMASQNYRDQVGNDLYGVLRLMIPQVGPRPG
jgi:hypothetical protein